MKVTIPEISWHNRDPVLSVDLQSTTTSLIKEGEPFWRLATGGADSHVLIWHITVNKSGAVLINCVADLNRHQKTVNVVRFSPSGELLASGDDESVIILWKQKEGSEPPPLPGEEQVINKEQWTSYKILRGHLEDVYDLSWSPDSTMLVSGSVDNTAIVWDIRKGRSINILQDYKGFVQGVSWDPLNQYITTLSTDRQCRLIDVKSMKTIQRASKAKIPTPPGHPLEGKTIRLFHDDTFKSFFRRLTFTIDGSLIIAPSGMIDPQDSTEHIINTTVVFSRHNIKEPIMILPSMEEPTVAVRCCPIYFEIRKDGPTPILGLPYRLVFAVASEKSVFIYDTQQISPLAVISNIHYTRLTDITWSSDARLLVVSSTDGYSSIIHFDEGELGHTYLPNQPISIEKASECTITTNENLVPKNDNKKPFLSDIDTEAMDIDVNDYKVNKKNAEPTNCDNKEKKEREVEIIETEESEDLKLVYTETNDEVPTKSAKAELPPDVDVPTSPKPNTMQVLSAKTPRRVQFITISSPKSTKKSNKGPPV